MIKTRRFAMAFERGRVSARSAQAWGFVSRMMVMRDGGGSSVQEFSNIFFCRRLLLRDF